MKKLKLDMSGVWVVRRLGKVYKVCAEDDSDIARVTFTRYEDARAFCDEANAMKMGGVRC